MILIIYAPQDVFDLLVLHTSLIANAFGIKNRERNCTKFEVNVNFMDVKYNSPVCQIKFNSSPNSNNDNVKSSFRPNSEKVGLFIDFLHF